MVRMTSVEQSLVERLLLLKLRELTWHSRLDDIAIDHTPDELDESQRAHDRELSLAVLEREVAMANQIRVALQRLQNGEYGLCILCGTQIGLKRLRAVPWTSLCVTCQGQVEGDRPRLRPRG